MKEIKTEIIMEATAELKEKILDELSADDPNVEEAEAILRNPNKKN